MAKLSARGRTELMRFERENITLPPEADISRSPRMFYRQGDAVFVNGYPGRILREYAVNLYEVRLDRGVVCVDISAINHPIDTTGTES